MATEPNDWANVRDELKAAMLQMRMTMADLERDAHVSRETIRPILEGEPPKHRPRELTQAKICEALGLTDDSILLALKGEKVRLRGALDTAARSLGEEVEGLAHQGSPRPEQPGRSRVRKPRSAS